MNTIHLADLFCGAGGTSTGAIEAMEILGYKPKLTAVNHWEVAINTHQLNHPSARHLTTGIDAIRPTDLFKPGELGILWASPECTHHSTARGGKPINDQSRSTAWCVPRWAAEVLPKRILVENVPEFETWGPVDEKGNKITSRKGEVFRAWINVLEALGYEVDWRILCAADYGDPTTRKRLFVQAVRDGVKIVWPDPTHTKDTEKLRNLKPWVSARSIIDWKNKGRSAFDRPKPLAKNTVKRIIVGLTRQGVTPFILPGFGDRKNQTPRTHNLNQPLPTVCAGGHFKLIEPMLICMEHGGRVKSIDDPIPTVTCAKGGAMAVAEAFILPQHSSNQARSIEKPLPTVTTTSRGISLVKPYIVTMRGTGSSQIKSSSHDIEEPLTAITAGGRHHNLVEPFILSQQSGGAPRKTSNPLPTVAAAGAIALAEPFIIKFYGTSHDSPIDAPLPTVTTKDRMALTEPKEKTTQEMTAVIDRVFEIDGETYPLANIDGTHCLVCEVDGKMAFISILMRMLTPTELAAGQGFRSDYKFSGNQTQTVKQIGNAVPRRLARAICLASLSQQSDIRPLLKKKTKAA